MRPGCHRSKPGYSKNLLVSQSVIHPSQFGHTGTIHRLLVSENPGIEQGRDVLASSRIAIIAIILAAYPVSRILSASAGWENGPIENLQNLVLVLGFVLATLSLVRCEGLPLRAFWALVALTWLVLAGREISWGAAFLVQPEMTPKGPAFSSSGLWYKPYVYPALALMLGALACFAAYARAWRPMIAVLKARDLPLFEIALVVTAFAISAFADSEIGLSSASDVSARQNAEEIIELAAYAALLLGQMRVAGSFRRLCAAGAGRVDPLTRTGAHPV